jgi:hypothetical protein
MSQSSNAKKIRRELNKRADAIEKNVALDIIEGLYRMPFWTRLKWAFRIVRGVRTERDRMMEWSLRFVWWLDELFETITRMGYAVLRNMRWMD